MRLIRTGITALDLMLFGDTYYQESSEAGFLPGDVVLIRGEPGSGKTTLALQIASGFLTANPQDTVQVLTVEEPKESMQRRCSHYNFACNTVHWMERPSIETLVKKVREESTVEARAKSFAESAAHSTSVGLRAAGALSPEGKLWTAVAEAAVVPMMKTAVQQLMHGVFHFKGNGGLNLHYSRLVIIDSLNALMNVMLKEFPELEPRPLFNTICQVLREYAMPKRVDEKEGKDGDITREPPVIVVIGEHHFHGSDTEKYLPESFFCDAEIVLRPEPVRLPRDSDPAANMTLGYDMAAIVGPEAKHLESRSFCRVVKSRSSPKQSRRCAYDIESGQGFRFFETYPGDGKLMLFAENEQQRASWASFFSRDLTDSYPALRYETFTMEGLETVYESSRRLLHVPLRTDMYLSSLDSYWVTGYRDYRLKTRINERLLKRMGGAIDARTFLLKRNLQDEARVSRCSLSTWICMEYPRFVNDLVYYALTSFEIELYRTNLAELTGRPRSARGEKRRRFDKQLEQYKVRDAGCRKKLEYLKKEMEEEYDPLCDYLFGTTTEKLCDEPGIVPKKHFGETFLRPLPRSGLTFYGQYNADLIPTLVRDDMHQFEGGEDYWLSIPYDANIGVFVARLDALKSALAARGFADRYRDAFRRLKRQEEVVLMHARKNAECLLGTKDPETLDRFKKEVSKVLRGCRRAQKEGPGVLPTLADLVKGERLSWDQVISLSAAEGRPFGIETRSFDTLTAFFLELVWNCGGRLEVDGRYKVQNLEANVLPLIRALHYFGAIFKFTPTHRDSTIDPVHFATAPEGPRVYGEWMFARYWYSTLVDALTATHAEVETSSASSQSPGERAAPERRKSFVWQAKGRKRPNIEILRMPRGDQAAAHYTCCGDWSFGLLEGSENVALACDLVSNLMGSVKVTERGLRGACLPTVSQFYWRYRDEPCVPATIRDDMELPQMTFGELGKCYLGTPVPPLEESPSGAGAKRGKVDSTEPHGQRGSGIFRQFIFDYRHCAREMYGELLSVKRSISQSRVASGGRGEMEDAMLVVTACINVVRGIEELRERYMFIRNSFRHDVAEVPLLGASRRRDWLKGKARLRRLALRETQVTVEGEMVEALNISRGGIALRRGAKWKGAGEVTVVFGTGSQVGKLVWEEDGKVGVAFRKVMEHKEYFSVVQGLTATDEPGYSA